ncbi:hypothetical protein AB0D32_17900 [Micromonospora sp. NPDC048170]|uniref:hypothetical protein n=1 Tax=Micromonospora sp. NPDC048170 TaxID=3154819 RepID=UPI0033CC04D0
MRTNPVVRSLAAATVLVLLVAVAAACQRDAPPGGDRSDPYHADAIRHGLAPQPHPDVTYQPDVVLVGGGGRSVRSVTDDGLTWRIDPDAERADELAPGRVMFLTGRAVGRVVDVRPEGDDLAVTIGPVSLTEVVRDGTFRTDRPVPLDRPVAYAAGEPAWAAADLPDRGGKGGGLLPAPSGTGPDGAGAVVDSAGAVAGGASGGSRLPGRAVALRAGPAPRPPQPPARSGGSTAATAGGMKLTPQCCADGVGLRFAYDDGDIRMLGAVTFVMRRPTASFDVAISGGTVTRAEFSVTGGAGLRVSIEAATRVGNDRNVAKSVVVPVQFSVPIGSILGVPFSATVDQLLEVRTVFTAKDGYFRAAGEYALTGAVGYGYRRPFFGPLVPAGFAVRDSLTNSITGVSIGVNGMLLSYDVKFTVGIGALGFSAGVYVGLRTTVGATLGSGAGLIVCRGAGINVTMRYGIGYSIPQVVADVVNFFLKVFRTRPIESSGQLGSQSTVVKRAETVPPDVPLCAT